MVFPEEQSVPVREWLEAPLRPLAHLASLRLNPEPALPVELKLSDSTAGQFRGVGRVEDHEFHAIEPCQTMEGCDPQIAVWCLSNGIDGIVGQTLLRLPRIDDAFG